MINEARIGFMGEYDLITPDTLGQGYPAKLGLAIGKADVFPAISITNVYSLGPGSPSFANYKENNIDIYWGAYLGTPDEILISGPLGERAAEIERVRSEARARHGWIMHTYLLRKT